MTQLDFPQKTRNLVKTLRRCNTRRCHLNLAQSLFHTTDNLNPDSIKNKCQERIRHLLHNVAIGKLHEIKSRANTAYDTNPKSYHRLLKT
jgi:ribonucleotide reductase beta subunit family protein with ferritin-like domain